ILLYFVLPYTSTPHFATPSLHDALPISHDVLEMSGSRAVWKEVLAVYSVKTTTDPDNPQEVATMDEGKKQLLSGIFWEMNEISRSEEHTSELQSRFDLVCRLLLEKNKTN